MATEKQAEGDEHIQQKRVEQPQQYSLLSQSMCSWILNIMDSLAKFIYSLECKGKTDYLFIGPPGILGNHIDLQ